MIRHSGGELDPEGRRHVCDRCALDAAFARCYFCWRYYCRRCWKLACRPAKKPMEEDIVLYGEEDNHEAARRGLLQFAEAGTSLREFETHSVVRHYRTTPL